MTVNETLAQHPFAWHTHIDVWVIMGCSIALYLVALNRHSEQPAATRKQKVAFVCGVLFLWVASDYPIHDLAENYLFSVHMVQHLFITMAAPPLLIMGMPDWMRRSIFCRPRVLRFSKFFFAPLTAALIFNATTVFTHWPVMVNAALNHHFLHFVLHVILFATAWAMWMPVFNRLPELPTMGVPMKMLYLFLQSIIPTVPAAFITFADKPVYSFYANAPRVWSGFSAVNDQQLAGAIMKIFGGGFLWLTITVIFFRWQLSEEREQKLRRKERNRSLLQDSV